MLWTDVLSHLSQFLPPRLTRLASEQQGCSVRTFLKFFRCGKDGHRPMRHSAYVICLWLDVKEALSRPLPLPPLPLLLNFLSANLVQEGHGIRVGVHGTSCVRSAPSACDVFMSADDAATSRNPRQLSSAPLPIASVVIFVVPPTPPPRADPLD